MMCTTGQNNGIANEGRERKLSVNKLYNDKIWK